MAVEIFTQSTADGTPQRTYGNEVTLGSSSNIYFGKGAPGIAYYEKAGTDLRITLLDGQDVLVRNFFVVGPEGDFSSLLLAQGGETEVTGMLAPEPASPDNGQIEPDQTVDDTPQAQMHAEQTAGAPPSVNEGGDTGPGGGTESAGLFGLSTDQLLWGLATTPVVYAAAHGFNDSDTSDAADATDPTDTTDPTDPTDPTDVTDPVDGGNTPDPSDPTPLHDTLQSLLDLIGLGGAQDSTSPESSLAGGMFGSDSAGADTGADTGGDTGGAALLGSEDPLGLDTLTSLVDGLFDTSDPTSGA
ncbi:MAG: hypothetical protein PHX82_12105 [Paracoccaceae bacterium]|nr:hypothetical protein [Paracoccaceae bacterium]